MKNFKKWFLKSYVILNSKYIIIDEIIHILGPGIACRMYDNKLDIIKF